MLWKNYGKAMEFLFWGSVRTLMIGPAGTVGLHVTSTERERGSSGEGWKVQAQSCLTNG